MNWLSVQDWAASSVNVLQCTKVAGQSLAVSVFADLSAGGVDDRVRGSRRRLLRKIVADAAHDLRCA
jgi:hypothetical protein